MLFSEYDPPSRQLVSCNVRVSAWLLSGVVWGWLAIDLTPSGLLRRGVVFAKKSIRSVPPEIR